MNRYTLSIITPAYNAADFLPDAIKSIVPQLSPTVQWIIVDDGSTDNTLKICNDLIRNLPNIYILHINNSGAGFARNFGITHAEGEWISFLDSDDLYLPNAIKDILAFIENIDSNAEIIYTPRSRTSFDLNDPIEVTYPEKDIINCLPKLEFWTCLYKLSFIKDNDIKFYQYRQQDVETAFRFLAFSKCAHLIKSSSLRFYLQRNNPKSNTHTWNLFNLYYIKYVVYFDLLDRADNNRDYLVNVIFEMGYKYYFENLLKGKEDQYKKRFDIMRSLLLNYSYINSLNLSSRLKFLILRMLYKR